VLLLLLIGVLSTLYYPFIIYRVSPSSESLHRALHQGIRNGDSYGKVTRLLGEGEGEESGESKLENLAKLETANTRPYTSAPGQFSDGIQKDDVFVLYPFEGNTVVELQFRTGVLINFDPSAYSPASYAQMKNAGVGNQ